MIEGGGTGQKKVSPNNQKKGLVIWEGEKIIKKTGDSKIQV